MHYYSVSWGVLFHYVCVCVKSIFIQIFMYYVCVCVCVCVLTGEESDGTDSESKKC